MAGDLQGIVQVVLAINDWRPPWHALYIGERQGSVSKGWRSISIRNMIPAIDWKFVWYNVIATNRPNVVTSWDVLGLK